MPRLPFVRHRTANQIRSQYRSCRHAAQTVRWHALGLLARTRARRSGCGPRTRPGSGGSRSPGGWGGCGGAGPGPAGGRSTSGWLYVYGFARPPAGETVAVILPRVKVERMADAPAASAAHADPGGKELPVVVADDAGWHTARRLAAPANVRLRVPPPRTAELQPVEPYWAPVREAVANDRPDRLTDLRRRVTRRCRRVAADRATVEGAIGFRRAAALEA